MKIVVKMEVGVNELLQINKGWQASGLGSFDAFVLKLLLAAAADAALKDQR